MSRPLDPKVLESIRRLTSGIEYTSITTRVTGFFDSAGNLYSDPQYGLAQGYIYVHDEGRRSSVPVIVGDRMLPYQRVAGKRCLVGLNRNGELVAFAPANDSFDAAGNDGQRRIADQSQYIKPEQLTFGLVTANEPGGYGLTVFVQPFTYRDRHRFGAVDVTASVPSSAGESRVAVIVYDYSADAFVVVNGTASLLPTSALDKNDAVAVALGGTDRIRLGAVLLTNGQTNIDSSSTFFDCRDLLTVHGVQTVVAGTNVGVDSTDPMNPVVSATFSTDFNAIMTDANFDIMVDALGNVMTGA